MSWPLCSFSIWYHRKILSNLVISDKRFLILEQWFGLFDWQGTWLQGQTHPLFLFATCLAFPPILEFALVSGERSNVFTTYRFRSQRDLLHLLLGREEGIVTFAAEKLILVKIEDRDLGRSRWLFNVHFLYLILILSSPAK